jgi:hypothetical protein
MKFIVKELFDLNDKLKYISVIFITYWYLETVKHIIQITNKEVLS